MEKCKHKNGRKEICIYFKKATFQEIQQCMREKQSTMTRVAKHLHRNAELVQRAQIFDQNRHKELVGNHLKRKKKGMEGRWG